MKLLPGLALTLGVPLLVACGRGAKTAEFPMPSSTPPPSKTSTTHTSSPVDLNKPTASSTKKTDFATPVPIITGNSNTASHNPPTSTSAPDQSIDPGTTTPTPPVRESDPDAAPISPTHSAAKTPTSLNIPAPPSGVNSHTASPGVKATANPPTATVPHLTVASSSPTSPSFITPVKTPAPVVLTPDPTAPATAVTQEILPFTAQVVAIHNDGKPTSTWTGADGTWQVLIQKVTETSVTFNPVSSEECSKTSWGCTGVGPAMLQDQTLSFASPNIPVVLPLNLNPDNGQAYTQGVTAPAWALTQFYNNQYEPAAAVLDSKYSIPSSVKDQIVPMLYSAEHGENFGYASITIKNGKIIGID